MSEEREKIENQFEELKQNTLRILDEMDKHISEAEELRNARREAEEKAWKAEEELKKKEAEIQSINDEMAQTKSEIERAKQNADALQSEKDEAVDAIRRERDELKAEMDQINSQLDRVSTLYREASAEKAKLEEKVDVSDLLAIYITLIETIFGGKPHARILYTLHDTKAAINRKNLEASTGIMPAAVIKAVHDLRNADLISYDEETLEVKLIKDIF